MANPYHPTVDVALLNQVETVLDTNPYYSAADVALLGQVNNVLDTALLPGVPTQRGPQGPAGLPGPQGPAGPAGVSGGFLTFTQNAVSTSWTINHSLGYYPNITTTDSSGTVIDGTISYPSLTTVLVTFSIATSGFAYLS